MADTDPQTFAKICTNFRLLKYRLNLIHLQSTNGTATNDINQVLELCSENKSRKFLEAYLNGELKPIVNEVSNDSIARLAFMLMNMNTVTQINQLDEVWQIVQKRQEENEKLSVELVNLSNRKKELEERRNHLRTENLPIVNNELVSQQLIDLQYITRKKIQDMQIFQILNWWRLEENNGRISLMSIPIIPVTNLTHYHMSLVLESFLKTCQFLKVLSNIYGIQLPHPMGTFQNQLRVGDRILNVRDLARFSELSNYGRKEFCICIAKILQNMIKFILHLNPEYRSTDLSFHDLLRFDKLLIHIVSVLKKSINYESMLQNQETIPIVEDVPSLLNWFQKEARLTTKEVVRTTETIPQTERDATLSFQRSLELSALKDPDVLSPPFLPPAAVYAWELLTNGKLTDALVELLVPDT
ncbi:hypothetical protein CANINC_002362 [Pichia inconspicua]|uniref:Uncharacterized protein n=1 Tax=Pichia inconspicua TaxID=52247 RepID=A0A4T0X1B8_9ASCO|nr:hypothetical protein CANINC_002362 [[Candida] inconspicua]